jgi:hypothetical protein
MKVSNESITVQQADDGNLLVTVDHIWTEEQRITFTVKVQKGNLTLKQLRKQATQEAIRLLGLPADKSA